MDQGPPPINREITISEGITVKELSEKLEVKAALVMKKLMDRGIFVAINQTLDGKLANEVAREFGKEAPYATLTKIITRVNSTSDSIKARPKIRAS